MLKDVLKILEDDARTTPEQIARMTGLSLDEIKKTVKKAEDDRTILKYKTVVNWDKVAGEQVRALIEVKITPQRDVGFDVIAERIFRFPEARSVYLVSGAYDLVALVAGKSMHQIADFVSQKLAPIEGVQGTATYFLLKRYKEDGEVLEGSDSTKRQPVIL